MERGREVAMGGKSGSETAEHPLTNQKRGV